MMLMLSLTFLHLSAIIVKQETSQKQSDNPQNWCDSLPEPLPGCQLSQPTLDWARPGSACAPRPALVGGDQAETPAWAPGTASPHLAPSTCTYEH